jgi:antitoxin MazE
MRVVIKEWDGDAAIRIPEHLMLAAELNVGQVVDIRVECDRLIVEPVLPPRLDLEAMLDAITDENRHEEVSTGGAVGGEIL